MGDEEIQVIKTKLTYQTWKKMKEKEREREEVQIIKTVRTEHCICKNKKF